MNKFVLFSALACSVFICNASFADGPTCRKTSDGKVVCNYIDRGGEPEKNLCYKEKANPDEENPDTNVWESWNDSWWTKKTGQDCTSGKPGAKSAKCIDNPNGYGTKNKSCAAYECKDNYLLYTTNKRHEISVIGGFYKVGSQGLCREKSYLKSLCDAGCGCDKNEKCVLNELKVKNHGKEVAAFIGEEMCVCVADNNGGGNGSGGNNGGGNGNLPGDENCEECVYTLKVDVKCANRKTFKKNEQIKVTKDEAEKLRWTEAKKKLDAASSNAVIENLLKEIEGYDTLIEKICGKKNSTVTVPTGSTDAEVAAAKKTLSAFFETTKQNRNVWRDKDGNFNTARLASDLTAGVVLGTVGGVVSGVVIKKKQVEKGFDALHCTVGGQTVADWGDTFTVGLR